MKIILQLSPNTHLICSTANTGVSKSNSPVANFELFVAKSTFELIEQFCIKILISDRRSILLDHGFVPIFFPRTFGIFFIYLMIFNWHKCIIIML